MALASVILGIIALVMAVLPVGLTQLVGVALGLVAVILGVIARRRDSELRRATRRATSGIVLGTLGLALGGLMFASCVVLMDQVGKEVEKGSKDIKQGLAEELTREFNRRRGSDEFHRALESVLGRATREGRVDPPVEKPGEPAAKGSPAVK